MTKNVISSAKTFLTAYRKALVGLEEGLGEEFAKAVDLMQGSAGHVVVCGMGKSGIIGRKISSSSHQRERHPCFCIRLRRFMEILAWFDPAMLFLLISYSGSTEEIVRLLPAFGRLDARLIALTGNPHSIIAEAAEITLDISVDREACPLNLAPTTSSLNSLVLGDALAVALMETRGFAETDFANTHPGGTLGRRLLTRVRDKMCTENLPFVDPEASVQDALMVMTEGRLGLALVGNAENLVGVITDGDLRRLLVKRLDIAVTKVSDVASPMPLTIGPDEMMDAAEAKMLSRAFNVLSWSMMRAMLMALFRFLNRQHF